MAESSELERIQARFHRLITQPEPVDDAARALSLASDPGAHPLASWLVGRDEAAVSDRLTVYANSYFVRHRDALREAYALVAKLVGEVRFDALAARYLAVERSDAASLDDFGASFVSWLGDVASSEGLRTDVGSLALLERVRREVFVAADARALVADDLAALPPDAWPTLVLALVPSARRVEARHTVAPLWLALEHESPLPDLESPARAETLLVWRRGFGVFHRALAPDEARALEHVAAGAPFATVCEVFDEAERALALLQQWLADELLRAPT